MSRTASPQAWAPMLNPTRREGGMCPARRVVSRVAGRRLTQVGNAITFDAPGGRFRTQMETIPTIALWGGIECTINRVGEQFFDQLERCGHYSRSGDLDAIAALGIKTLRYPALWERMAPHGLSGIDWSGCDHALQRLRDLGVEPIIGLVHHGSGPAGTDLLDPRFVDGLAAYAAAFAERYPWVRQYTPINEPLTTARFAGLYGHWYPHRRDDRAFVAALVTQCRAIAAAMAAIREHVPHAELVQTEDAGSVRVDSRCRGPSRVRKPPTLAESGPCHRPRGCAASPLEVSVRSRRG